MNHTIATATRRSVGLVAALVMGCALLVAGPAPAQAAGHTVPVKVKLAKPSAAQTGVGKVTTTVKLTAAASSHKASKITITVKLNPTGSTAKTGAAVTKRVTAKWSNGAYRATAKIVSKGVGPLTASARVAGKTSTATAKAPASPSSKITGWDASTVLDAGKTTTDTLTLTPAYGRKVALQRWTGSTWSTTKTLTTAKTKSAKVTVTVAAPASGAAKWRVTVPATVQARTITTSTRSLTARAKSTITGWTGSSTSDAGTTITPSATIAPAFGRKVQLQRWTGSTWSTSTTFTTALTATSTIAVTLTTPSSGTTSWRLYAPVTTKGQAVTSGSFALSAKASTPDPSPSPTPTDEPTWADPSVWTGPGRGGADCNALTFDNVAYSCATPAISNVAGRTYVDDRCGVTRSCLRSPLSAAEQTCYDPVDDWDAFMKSIPWYRDWFCGRYSWTPPTSYVDEQRDARDAGQDAPYYNADEPLYLPDLLDELNTCRTQGCYDDYGTWWPTRGAQPFLAMPGATSSVSVTKPDSSTTTLTIPGQGGHAQVWAEHLADVCHTTGVCFGSWVHGGWDEVPVPTQNNPGEYGARGKARAESAVNDPGAVTAPPIGKKWQLVGEIYAQGTASPHDLILGWMSSSGHRGAVMQKYLNVNDAEQQEYVLTGASVDPEGSAYAIAQFYILQDA